MMDARQVALQALLLVDRGSWLDKAVRDVVPEEAAAADRRLAHNLAYGVTSNELTLDYILNRFCRKGINSLSPVLRIILRIGLYQLMYLDRVPDYAVLNEAAAQARKHAGPAMAGLVNGVLRNVLRSRETLLSDLPREVNKRISVEFSHPLWIVDHWLERWGEKFTRELCLANNQPAPLSLRVNTEKISKESLLSMLADWGIEARPSKWDPNMLVLPAETAFSQLPAHDQGLFSIMGESSALPVQNLGLTAGLEVLDMCSAPGGKAVYAAELVRPATVTAIEIHSHRATSIVETARRLGLDNVAVITGDARDAKELTARSFPRILLDAPCSGSGVLRKKPDIKWRYSEKDIKKLVLLQKQLLAAACNLLEPGGFVVYSTCSLLRWENEEVVEGALAAEDMVALPVSIGGEELRYGNIFPSVHGIDGFFLAKLQKVV